MKRSMRDAVSRVIATGAVSPHDRPANTTPRAMLWNGTPRQLLDAAREQRVRLYTSPPLLDELTRILARRKFDKKIAASGFSAAQLVERYAALAVPVRPVVITGIAPDPDDDVVLGTALAVHAELIVTGDRDLLELGEYCGIPILTAIEELPQIA